MFFSFLNAVAWLYLLCCFWLFCYGFSSAGLLFVEALSNSEALITGGGNDPCFSFASCDECISASSNDILLTKHNCSWCVSTHRCMHLNGLIFNSLYGPNLSSNCHDFRNAVHKPTCYDTLCFAAHVTNNIYICRPMAIVSLFFTCVLAIVNICFYFWFLAIRQFPWKYEQQLSYLLFEGKSLTDVVLEKEVDVQPITFINLIESQVEQKKQEEMNGITQENVLTEDEIQVEYKKEELLNENQEKRGEEKEEQKKKQNSFQSVCPMCKMTQEVTLDLGSVCFWCNVARAAFLPLYIGISTSFLSFMLLFFVSLRPSFADVFYTYLLLSAFASYIIFILLVCIRHSSNVYVKNIGKTFYIRLAFYLRGRSLFYVFPTLAEINKNITANGFVTGIQQNFYFDGLQEMTLSSYLLNSENGQKHEQQQQHQQKQKQQQHEEQEQYNRGSFFLESNFLSLDEIEQKKVETIQLLNMTCLNDNFCKVLCKIIRSDEYILWCEKPDILRVMFSNLWLFVVFVAGIALGLWIFIVSIIKETEYVFSRFASGTSMIVVGVLLVIFFSCLLITTLSSTVRLYVLTNRRLLSIFSGVISPTVSEVDIRNLRCASVYIYKLFLNPLFTFSWEVPIMERKLPEIKAHCFSAIISLKEFLYYFNAIAPQLSFIHDQTRKDMRHRRKVWRMHIFFCIAFFQFLPVFIFYIFFISATFSVFLFIIIGTFLSTILWRGLCAQYTTHISLHVANNLVGLISECNNKTKDMLNFLNNHDNYHLKKQVNDKFVTNITDDLSNVQADGFVDIVSNDTNASSHETTLRE